jgi:hypothetical protein
MELEPLHGGVVARRYKPRQVISPRLFGMIA